VEIDTIICGDVMEVLSTLPDGLVQTVITSPPYWGLRDYGIDGQLGLEPTPEEYVEKMVQIFREVRRVLRDDGTVWLNLGDSYGSNFRGGPPGTASEKQLSNRASRRFMGSGASSWTNRDGTIYTEFEKDVKPKDLVGIPWRVAFALQADGWYLRSDIVWSKPNPMPESVTDRPTKAHEYLFLLTKSARYYYDQEAVREPVTGNTNTPNKEVSGKRPNRNFPGQAQQHHCGGEECGSRNKRTVWTIATQPYSECHFAVFPEALVEPCILAGTSEYGCCPECGAPWERVVEVKWGPGKRKVYDRGRPDGMIMAGRDRESIRKELGWQPTCSHNLDPTPCIVLDPFIGSGTTALVAIKHRRHYLGIELNPEYVEQANRRLSEVQVKLI